MRHTISIATIIVLLLIISGCSRTPSPVTSNPLPQSGWEVLQNRSVSDLHALWFTDSLHGWVGGGSGLILHTSDGGHTWQQQSSGTGDDIRSIFFSDSVRGWAVGWNKRILATTDGGEHWTMQFYEPRFGGTLEDIAFADAGNGWAVGHFPVVHTTDGGRNWSYTNTLDPASCDLQGISFADATHGWIVGSKQVMRSNGINFDFVGVILRTTDGGQTWDTTSGWGTLYDINAIDPTTAWAVGTGGTIVRTTDGGTTWQQQQSGTSVSLESIHFVDHQHGWAVGGEYEHAILHTSDGGLTWREQYTQTNSRFNEVFFLNSLTGWIVADEALLHTERAGIEQE
jgi:photosystem II stability/assembly factor-like uncharacterized protein